MTSTFTVVESPALVRGFSMVAAGDHSLAAPGLPPLWLSPLGGGIPATGVPVLAWRVWLQTGPSELTQVDCTRDALTGWARDAGEAVWGMVKRRLAAVEGRRPAFAGLDMARPHVMGIVNVTPDSFSDGGDHFDPGTAVQRGLEMLAAGATVLDVGGESTRPGADPVSPQEEIRRVVPVIRAFADRGAVVSIDTRHAVVMEAAVAAGAAILNDVTGLLGDPDSLPTAVRLGKPVMLMHMQGEDPRTMQADPSYPHAPVAVFEALARRVEACLAAGISREALCVDPGIGFGKTVEHNAALMRTLGMLHGLGCPVLLGASRKSFIGRLAGVDRPKDRLPGSLTAAIRGWEQGVQIVRVHDVAETVQALKVWQA
ncbi:dihydropteroate synthase [Novispirillum itersonii]|uniref:dihydropteroate synthase n=1 Tax=Novispirillum itersonii TaxID=189 RepID=UPI00037AC467|nr:dihydropteroate synthase [Novispirillum itersonii]